MNTPTNNSTRKSSRSAAPREFLTYSSKNTQDKIIKQGPDAKLSPKKNPVGGSSSPTKKAKSVTSKVTPGAPQKPILTQEEKQELREENLPEEKMETEVIATPTPETAEVTTTEMVNTTQETVQQDALPAPQEEEEEEEEEEDWSQEQFMPFVDPDEVRERVRLEKEANTTTTTTTSSSSSFSPLAEKLKQALNTPVSGELNGQMQGITFQEEGEGEEEEEEEEVQVTGQKNKFGFLTKEFYDPKNQGVIPHQKPNGKYYNKEGREVDQYGFHPIGLYHSWDGVSAHQKPDGKRYNKEGKRVNRWFQELDHQGGKLVNSQEEDE